MPHVTYFWDEIEDNVVEEYDGDTGATIASYTTVPTRYGSVLSQDRSGQRQYFQFDGQGNTAELTDSDSIVTDTSRYSGFGTLSRVVGTTTSPYTFGGAYGYSSGSELGFLVVRYRNYTPSQGRWQSADPLGAAIAVNRFRYCQNIPTTSTDPSGLIDWRPANYTFGGTPCYRPKGFDYVHGRTSFVRASIGASEILGGVYRSQFVFNWHPNRAAFGATPCCCCNLVGFIQVVTSQTEIFPQSPFTEVTTDPFTPHVDLDIPYPYAPDGAVNTNSPCNHPHSSPDTAIAMVDSPGYHIPAGILRAAARQTFETCVVCLTGVEGIAWRTSPFGVWDPSSEHEIDDAVIHPKAMAVYGCLKWGHKFYRSPITGLLTWTRFIQSAVGVEVTFGPHGSAEVPQMRPSQEWKDGVMKFYRLNS